MTQSSNFPNTSKLLQNFAVVVQLPANDFDKKIFNNNNNRSDPIDSKNEKLLKSWKNMVEISLSKVPRASYIQTWSVKCIKKKAK